MIEDLQRQISTQEASKDHLAKQVLEASQVFIQYTTILAPHNTMLISSMLKSLCLRKFQTDM